MSKRTTKLQKYLDPMPELAVHCSIAASGAERGKTDAD